jgi:hypothetical protein
MDISIVSGTYNRLSYLTKMVESGRQSLGSFHGLSHEFVLVDGGSTDGTLDWIGQQPDCRLIEHGALRGAVKAFNDGAYAANGQYVILANDDIEFLRDTIYLGWLYMQNNPLCGIGCFYQDRNGLDWHVERMATLVPVGNNEHRPQTGYYGQVCIVPKWLGDEVGWWGDYLHTYGGDNEISCNVYEVGYRVEPVPGTRIHDAEAADELRRINNVDGAKDPRAVYGQHRDSYAWGRKWRKPEYGGLTGPTARDVPIYTNPLTPRDRVVYLPIYEPGFEIQKQQKRGLREALAKAALVAEFDYVTEFRSGGKALMLANLQRLISKIDPTIVLTQLHNGANIDQNDIASLRMIAPKARFVNWNGDYWPDNLLSDDGIKLARSFDLMTTVNRDVNEKYLRLGINSAYWQIGYEPDGVGHEPDTFDDVVFLANGYSPDRQAFVKRLKSLNGFSFGLYGAGWPSGWAKGNTLYNFIEGCKIYRGAKISIGDSQWPDSGFVSNRVFQALAAGGSALAHQWFRGMEELGLTDGETCLVWSNFKELEDKIRYYLRNEAERQAIAKAGVKLALERHSFDIRVQELLEVLGKNERVEAGEYWR